MAAMLVSNCCRDALEVRGGTTQCWVCRNCGKPCDAMVNPPLAPVEVPVRLGRGGPVVGTARVTGDEVGVAAEFTVTRPGEHVVDFGELPSMSFRVPDDGS
jgi:hypothetical protein